MLGPILLSMEIIVESNLYISKVFEPPLVLGFQEESVTIRSLLTRLAEQTQSLQFISEQGLLGCDIDEMTDNGRNFFALKEGIHAPLKEGDRVSLQIQAAQLGGG